MAIEHPYDDLTVEERKEWEQWLDDQADARRESRLERDERMGLFKP